MILKKTYYSISEVSKMLNIQEHTIRFWDSKLPNLSKRDSKGKTRFFNLKQIERLSKLNDILKKNILENNKNIVPIIQKRLENIYTYINTINEELNELENDIENKENNNYILNEIIQLTKLENNYNIIKKILI